MLFKKNDDESFSNLDRMFICFSKTLPVDFVEAKGKDVIEYIGRILFDFKKLVHFINNEL